MRTLTLFFLLTFTLSSHADFLSGAVGFTTMRDPVTGKLVPGIINFAVLDRSGGAYGDTWATRFANFDLAFRRGEMVSGAKSPRLDSGARYLYLYQTTNDGSTVTLKASTVGLLVQPGEITSWGSFPEMGFADNPDGDQEWTQVSATHNFGSYDPEALPGQASFLVYYPRVVRINTPESDVGLAPQEVLLSNRAVRASWTGGPLLTPGRRGTLFGFTSNYPPTMVDGHVVIQCGGAGQPPCP